MQHSRWTTIALGVFFWGWFVPGCQTFSLPTHSVANGADDYETWLHKSITGQYQAKPAPVAQQSPRGGGQLPGATGVQQASATTAAAGDPNVQRLGASITEAEKNKGKKTGEQEESDGFDWSSLDPSKLWSKAKAAAGYGPDESMANSLYREGMDLYGAKKYAEAAKKFGEAAGRWPDSVLEEDALFYQAESYFFDDQYGKAHDTYGMLCKKHENSRYLDTVVAREFAIGRYWEQAHRAEPHWPVTPNFTDNTRPWFDTHGNALNAYLSVRLNDPTGPMADDAVMATGNAYFENARYEDAAIQYDLIRKEYPKSEHQKDAHLLALQSKLRSYQGPYYEGKPLEQADDLARQTSRQFRGQLGPEQTRVMKTIDDIRNQKAERDYALGQFYEKKRAYGAARISYQELLKQYPDTQYAAMAKQRLEEIKDYPAQPPNHFKWLTDAFDKLK